MYRTIEFTSGWPDNSEFATEGNQVAPGARQLADEIAAHLASRVEEAPEIEQHSYYGWGFYCRFDGASYDCVFNPAGDSGYLTIQYLGYLFHKLLWRNPRARFESFCGVVGSALAQISDLSGFHWQSYRS